MNHEVMITCAITGDDTKVTKSPHCAITPEGIAGAAIEAAQAGAAMVHIHVRNPETGAFSMETRHYREVVKRIRESKVDVIVNLTCGMGGYICASKDVIRLLRNRARPYLFSNALAPALKASSRTSTPETINTRAAFVSGSCRRISSSPNPSTSGSR